jgi:mono/diheme cytochrome c family protein
MRTCLSLIGSLSLLLAGAAAHAQDDAKAAQLFKMYCANCHGDKGDGQGPLGKTLNPPPRDFTKGDFKFGGTDEDIYQVISNGAAAKGGSPMMAPWGAAIPEADRRALVKFVRSLKK